MGLQEIRGKIARMGYTYAPGNSSRKGHLYNPLPFKELSDIPHQRSAVYERFDLIEKAVSEKATTLLDLGCHTGFNCFMFEKVGLVCTGLESHELSCEIAQDVAEHFSQKAWFIRGDITPEKIEAFGKVDVCLFLSVFQWITKKEGFDYAKSCVKAAMEHSEQLFFETSMGTEGKAKMPMLPNEGAVLKMLKGIGVHSDVAVLGKVEGPMGGSRTVFVTS